MIVVAIARYDSSSRLVSQKNPSISFDGLFPKRGTWDSLDQIYQIEIQLTSYSHLSGRIIYNWADIYSQQLKNGQGYGKLRPTYSIWLLAENLIHDDCQTIHHYKMRDEQGRIFSNHGGIWLLELNKFDADRIDSEEQRWLKFFKDGGQLDDRSLPDWMRTEEMQQAMKTLTTFSEKGTPVRPVPGQTGIPARAVDDPDGAGAG